MQNKVNKLLEIQSQLIETKSQLERISLDLSDLIQAERLDESATSTAASIPSNVISSSITEGVSLKDLTLDRDDLGQSRDKISQAYLHRVSGYSTGPYRSGTFLKITNHYRDAFGTIGVVLWSDEVHTVIEDFDGHQHKREHHNFTSNLNQREQRLVSRYLKHRK